MTTDTDLNQPEVFGFVLEKLVGYLNEVTMLYQ